jgi:uncharacterized protein (TIGR02147 family)
VDAQLTIQNILRASLVDRQTKNPAFSLRSFAKKLGMSPSAISEILAGKRRVSIKLATRILDRLAAPPEERQSVLDKFQAATKPGASAESNQLSAPSQSYIQLSADHFHAVSDWYHFAILSLMETKIFQDDPTWIAERLGIKVGEAQAAIERMLRLGMIKIDAKGQKHPSSSSFESPDEVANVALRKAHHQNLELAARSLEEDSVEDRDITSMTMAIDRSKLKEAKKMIRDFQDKLSAFLESGHQDEVYKINIQLFPLTQVSSEESPS